MPLLSFQTVYHDVKIYEIMMESVTNYHNVILRYDPPLRHDVIHTLHFQFDPIIVKKDFMYNCAKL